MPLPSIPPSAPLRDLTGLPVTVSGSSVAIEAALSLTQPSNSASPYRRYAPIGDGDRAPTSSDDFTFNHAATSEGSLSKCYVSSAGTGAVQGSTLVTFAAPGTGRRATGHCLVSPSGTVMAVIVDDPGSGYTAAPAVTFSGPGTGIVAAASLKLSTTWNAKDGVYSPIRTATRGAAGWKLQGQGAVLPGDVGAPVAAYGTRKMVAAYAGPLLQVVRLSDSTSKDIGFTASGELDTATLDAFAYGTTAAVSILYDQTGNGNHATQTTAANRMVMSPINVLHGPSGARTIMSIGPNFNTGDTNRWLNIPSTVALTANAFSTFMVARLPNCLMTHPLLEFTNASTPFQLKYGLSAWVMSAVAGGSSRLAPFKPHTGAMVIGCTQGPTGGFRQFMGNDSFVASATPGSAAMAGGYIGAHITGTPIYSDIEFSALLIYPSEVVEASRLDLQAALNARYNIAPQQSDRVVQFGDSITATLHCTKLQTTSKYLRDLLGVPAQIYNAGSSGSRGYIQTASAMGWVAPLFNPAARNNVGVYAFGTNDIVSDGLTGAQAYAGAVSFVQQMRTLGFPVKLIICTIIGRGVFTTGQAAEAAAFNALALANSAGFDAVCDYTADPTFGPGFPTSGVSIDGTHPSDLGYPLMMQALAVVIRSLWAF